MVAQKRAYNIVLLENNNQSDERLKLVLDLIKHLVQAKQYQYARSGILNLLNQIPFTTGATKDDLVAVST